MVGRAYRPETVTLATTWRVDGGELELADSLVAEVEGRFLPATVLVRRLTARGRAVAAQLYLAPRFGYDRRHATRTGWRAGALVCEHGDLAIAVTSDGPTVEPDRPVEFEVRPGEPVTITLTAARRSMLIVVPPAVAAAEAARDEAGWRTWAAGIEAPDTSRCRRAQPDDPAAPHLLALGRAGRRPHDLAARADRWRPQLGLPLRLAPGRLHRHRRLPRRRQAPGGARLSRLASPRQPPGPAPPPGPVHPGRARPGRPRPSSTAGPATPAAARYASATAPPANTSSTATAG